MIDERALAIQAEKRLGWPPSQRLRIQTMIPAALANLAKMVSRDPKRRNMLMTDPDVVQVTVTPGVQAVGMDSVTGSADLSSIVDTYSVMLDALQYGTIYHQYQVPFTAGDVITGAWPTGAYVEIADLDQIFGTDPIYFETTGSLPANITANMTFYPLYTGSALAIGFAVSQASQAADQGVAINSAGSGNSTMLSFDQILQWLSSPTQGGLTTCLPFSMLQGWLVGYTLNVKGIAFSQTYSKLKLAVPYVPTVNTFPDNDDLLSDLLDTLVGICQTQDIESPDDDRPN